MRRVAVVVVDLISWTICRLIDWRYDTNWTNPEYDD